MAFGFQSCSSNNFPIIFYSLEDLEKTNNNYSYQKKIKILQRVQNRHEQ